MRGFGFVTVDALLRTLLSDRRELLNSVFLLIHQTVRHRRRVQSRRSLLLLLARKALQFTLETDHRRLERRTPGGLLVHRSIRRTPRTRRGRRHRVRGHERALGRGHVVRPRGDLRRRVRGGDVRILGDGRRLRRNDGRLRLLVLLEIVVLERRYMHLRSLFVKRRPKLDTG